MGFWKSERGINGDSWADEMDKCMRNLSKLKAKRYRDELNALLDTDDEEGHEVTMQEFADLVEFCSRGHLLVSVRHPEIDGVRPLSQLYFDEVQTYPNAGQLWVLCDS